jgi:hypothetical protein
MNIMNNSPMDEPYIKISRVKLACAIAVAADLLEFPITWLESFQMEFLILIGRAAGVLLDCAVGWALSTLLGFNWVFLPSFIAEVLPTVDLFPSWVASVAFVVWQRKKQEQTQPQSQALRPLIDVEQIKTVGASLVSRLSLPSASTTQPLAETPPPIKPLHERLQSLHDLHDKNLISQAEYEVKRQQVLAEM